MWLKQGNIFNKHWAQLPVVDIQNDNFWRIYYSNRINNKSLPKYFDVEKGNPSKILQHCEEPILPLGELGTFDQAGVMPAEIITFKNKKLEKRLQLLVGQSPNRQLGCICKLLKLRFMRSVLVIFISILDKKIIKHFMKHFK